MPFPAVLDKSGFEARLKAGNNGFVDIALALFLAGRFNVEVNQLLTINNGEKMSKSRGTGLSPLKYLDLGMNPEWLRYYLAAKLSCRNEDIDFVNLLLSLLYW